MSSIRSIGAPIYIQHASILASQKDVVLFMGFHGAFKTELFFVPICYCFEAPLLANLAAARPLLSPQEQTKAAPATAPEAPQATLTRNDI